MEKSKKLRERRKKALKRRLIFFSSIILVGGAIIFFVKAPIFNVKSITFQGVKNVDQEELIKNTEFLKGQNIFLVGKNDIKDIIDSDQYIKSINVKKQGINSIKLVVSESKINYYYEINQSKYIINDKFEVVDIKEETPEGLIKIECSQLNNKNKGEQVDLGEVEKELLVDFIGYFEKIEDEHPVNSMDINNISDIRIFIDNVQVYMGNANNIKEKLNIVLNILDDTNINLKSGYINVSVEGVPVIKKDEVVDDVIE